MAKLAFLGLGLMGTPMATRLLEAGHDVTVWNRTSGKTEPLVHRGASAASSPAGAVDGADAVITMLATPQALQQVLFAPDGAAGALIPGQWLIDMSTVGPETIRSVARRLPSDVTLVDAPVRGSVPEATTGRLAIYVGASDVDFAHVQPLLNPLGSLHHVGGPGAGAATTLVVKLTLGVTMAALGEALSPADTLGLDRETLLDILAESPIGTTVRTKRAKIESGTYPPGFKLRLALEDLRLVTQSPAQPHRELRLAAASRSWLEQAERAGADDLDYSAVVATILGADPGPSDTHGEPSGIWRGVA
jgi:3-hydroxyisobutyrate dehydrogenase-like beta-hydroxyacid dehydrogenase